MISLIHSRFVESVLVAAISGWAATANGDVVKITESTVQIQTYLLGSEDPNPPFQLLNENDVYPYTMLDDLTDQREPRSYRALVLENDYLRATVLPELGGRLYSLYDKIAKREVFYRNNSVKYGLVALRGAWISGGIEFNFPNGHTTDTVSPVSSICRFNSDGSATVFVGDVDQVSEMYWEVALTLRPGIARLEEHVQLFNPTPTENLYWYWNNAAVPATTDARFIYPMRRTSPGVDADLHTFPRWRGIDYSRYGSFREPSELFGIGVHRDFFGVYYDEKNYGLIHYADHRQVTGKKFWTWGVAGDGTIWTDLLTDSDGPYNEIQAGRFETQFNREFMPAHAVESWTEDWYPVKQLDGGIVDASEQVAMNVSLVDSSEDKGEVRVALSPTEHLIHATLGVYVDRILKKSFGDLTFEPAVTRVFVLPIADKETAKGKISVELLGESGNVLSHWNASEPVDGNADAPQQAAPSAVSHTGRSSLDEQALYLQGVLEDKRGNHEAGFRLIEEALKLNPNYIPALRALAMQEYLGDDLDASTTHIVRALQQSGADPQTQYDAGVIWRAAGNRDRARDAFWSSVQLGESPVPALIQLGELALCDKEYATAQQLLREALKYRPDDALAQSELSSALRLDGKLAQASAIAASAATAMPLYPPAVAERWRVGAMTDGDSPATRKAERDWNRAVGDRLQGYLESGSWYWSLADYRSSDFVLTAAIRAFGPQQVSPMVYYYLASNAHHRGSGAEALVYAAKARLARYDKVFINSVADAQVLQEALIFDPHDAHAEYLLGNFMFQHRRFAVAERLWLQAQRSGFAYSVLYRNLGVNAWRITHKLDEAGSFYEKAIELAPQDYRLYVDLDQIYAQQGSTAMRAKLFSNIPSGILDHDSARIRYIVFLLKETRYEEALSLLNEHRFKPWEHGADVHEIFSTANIQKGRLELSARHFAQAEAAFARALEYPTNLGVGKPDKPSCEAAHYWLGESAMERGDTEKARQEWQIFTGKAPDTDMSKYYGALALEHLGQKAEATERLTSLAHGPEHGRTSGHNYYVAGLAQYHLGREAEAANYLRRAIELDPSLWQADEGFDK